MIHRWSRLWDCIPVIDWVLETDAKIRVWGARCFKAKHLWRKVEETGFFRGRNQTEMHIRSSLANAAGSSLESSALQCSLIGSKFLGISTLALLSYACGHPGSVRPHMSWDLQLRQTLQQLTADSLQLDSKSFLEGFFLCIVPCRALLEAEAKEKLHNTYPIFILNVSIWYIMHSAFILIFKTIALTYLSWLPNFFGTPHPYILPPYSQLSSSTTFFRERDEKELHFLPCAFSSKGYIIFQKLSI